MAPLYSFARNGPSRWIPTKFEPLLSDFWYSLNCSMHHSVCSLVSVSMEQSQEVVPFEAKNSPIFSSSSAVAEFTSTPTPP